MRRSRRSAPRPGPRPGVARPAGAGRGSPEGTAGDTTSPHRPAGVDVRERGHADRLAGRCRSAEDRGHRDRDAQPPHGEAQGERPLAARPRDALHPPPEPVRQVCFRTAPCCRGRLRAASFGRQQRLYFRPLPHGHGAPRCVVACRRRRCPNSLVKTRRTICENRSTRLAIRRHRTPQRRSPRSTSTSARERWRRNGTSAMRKRAAATASEAMRYQGHRPIQSSGDGWDGLYRR